jgi:putative acetyltransferase
MTAVAFTIREYRPGDAAPMAQLYFESARKLGPRGYTEEQVAAWAPAPAEAAAVHARASDGRLTLVAVDEHDCLLAYADLERDGHVDHLYCHPHAAGRGLAGALVDELTRRAAAQGLERLYVEASELARPVLERKGFGVLHRRDFEVRGVAIHNYAMELRLRPAVR